MRGKWIAIVPLALAGILFVGAMGGLVVRELWNTLLPPLFGWPAVTFWQALGLLALCRILFGGIGHGGRCRSRRSFDDPELLHRRIRERFGVGPQSGADEARG